MSKIDDLKVCATPWLGEDAVIRRREESRIAELDGVFELARQRAEKPIEPIQKCRRLERQRPRERWKLQDDRARAVVKASESGSSKSAMRRSTERKSGFRSSRARAPPGANAVTPAGALMQQLKPGGKLRVGRRVGRELEELKLVAHGSVGDDLS